MNQQIFQTLRQCRVEEKILIGFTDIAGGPVSATVAKAVHVTGDNDDYIEICIAGNGYLPRKVNIFNIWHLTIRKEET